MFNSADLKRRFLRLVWQLRVLNVVLWTQCSSFMTMQIKFRLDYKNSYMHSKSPVCKWLFYKIAIWEMVSKNGIWRIMLGVKRYDHNWIVMLYRAPCFWQIRYCSYFFTSILNIYVWWIDTPTSWNVLKVSICSLYGYVLWMIVHII